MLLSGNKACDLKYVTRFRGTRSFFLDLAFFLATRRQFFSFPELTCYSLVLTSMVWLPSRVTQKARL